MTDSSGSRSLDVLLLTGGGVHDWRGCGAVLKELLSAQPDFTLTVVEDNQSILSSEALYGFHTMVFYWTVGEISAAEVAAWSRWLKSGRGLVGVHGAAASFKGSDPYRAMLGGYLLGHPPIREYQVSVLDRDHPVTAGIDEFTVCDEQYLCSYDSRVNVLATALYQGQPYPVIWARQWGRGRVLFNALGHDPDACRHPVFQDLVIRGVRWTAAALQDS